MKPLWQDISDRLPISRGALVAVLIAYAMFAYAIVSISRNASIYNRKVNHNQAVLCQLLELATGNARTALRANPDQLRRAEQFYVRALQLAGCSDTK